MDRQEGQDQRGQEEETEGQEESGGGRPCGVRYPISTVSGDAGHEFCQRPHGHQGAHSTDPPRPDLSLVGGLTPLPCWSRPVKFSCLHLPEDIDSGDLEALITNGWITGSWEDADFFTGEDRVVYQVGKYLAYGGDWLVRAGGGVSVLREDEFAARFTMEAPG